jgi:hypothetical protein
MKIPPKTKAPEWKKINNTKPGISPIILHNTDSHGEKEASNSVFYSLEKIGPVFWKI